jgi:hypothetical protein
MHKACCKRLMNLSLLPMEDQLEELMCLPDLPYTARPGTINNYVNIGCFGAYAIGGRIYRGWATIMETAGNEEDNY